MIGLLRRLAATWSLRPAAVSVEVKPTQLPLGPGSENPIHHFFDDIGLPWRTTRAEVERTYGTVPDPAHDGDITLIDDAAPIVDGLLQPLSAQVNLRYAPGLPILCFTGRASFGDDPHDNLHRAATGLTARLGPTQIGRSWNKLWCGWTCGAASIVLEAWPVEWQPDGWNYPPFARDPRLVSACFVTVQTGFRRALSLEEEGWLADFVAIAPIRGSRNMTPARLRNWPAEEHESEFVREPPARLQHLFGRMGSSASGEALIFCLGQLYVIPASQILRFVVDRVLPAKGGGGSSLIVECATGIAAEPTKRLTIATADNPDGLNDTGAAIARALSKPFVLGEYGYDV